jgi:glutathione S-transferase
VIALRTKDVKFETTYIDLRNKPDWFLKISPHGKVPVLLVDELPLFESNAIAEYLDETVEPRLHPSDPLTRARHRAWTDFVSDFAASLSSIYYAKTKADSEAAHENAQKRLDRVEYALSTDKSEGPFFGGNKLCLVDAAYAPFFQRFLIADVVLKTDLLDGYPKTKAWALELMGCETIKNSVADVFEQEFEANLVRRHTYTATLMVKAA